MVDRGRVTLYRSKGGGETVIVNKLRKKKNTRKMYNKLQHPEVSTTPTTVENALTLKIQLQSTP